MKRRLRAFTLLELLVVIAITAILMTLIIIPVVQSFNITRAAQGWAEAQDKARTLTERIGQELGRARSVRDNGGVHGELDVVVPARPGSGSAVAGYDAAREWIRVPIYNAKLDLVLPSSGDASLRRAGAFINPITGMADPTLSGPKGQVNLPSTPGLGFVRYFVGLRDPLRLNQAGSAYAGYLEPYTGLLQQKQGIRDNLYVLYRAEVQPLIWSQTQNKFVVNKAFFYDLNRDNDPNTSGPRFDDPTFFDPAVANPAYSVADPDGTPDPTKAQMVQNWMRIAVIQTEVSRFDMIQPVYDLRTRQVQYDGDAPRLMTLIQFRPTRVSSEPASGQTAVRQGDETESAERLGPDVFLTKFTGWANTVLRTYADSYGGNANEYEVGLGLRNPAAADPQGFAIWGFDPDQGPYEDIQVGQVVGGTSVGVELFDVDVYRRGLLDGVRANFSRGIASSNSRSGWLSNVAWRNLFEPYVPNFDRGRTLASFSISEVGSVSSSAPFTPAPLPDPVYNPNNLPGAVTWPDSTAPLSPFNDPNVTAGVFSDPLYASINKKYNKIWNDFPSLRGNIHRFIDLRVTPNDDGAPSPLTPDPATGFARAQIVPGSEQVYGPDQNPGANYGNVVRYTRTTRDPGPNQYRINYTNLPEPDYSLLGFAGTPPATYTPTDFLSAVIQPRYKAGYIQLNSDPNIPLPGDFPATQINEAKILVSYRFQFTHPNDVMAVDYDSRQLMTVQMTIREYPQSSLPNPQTVTLYSTAQVRNFLR